MIITRPGSAGSPYGRHEWRAGRRTADDLAKRSGVAAVVMWAAVLTAGLVACPLPYGLGGLRFALPAAAGLILAGRPAWARLRTAPAVLLAGLPLILMGALTGTLGPLLLAPLLGALLAAAVAVSVRRRRGRQDPLIGA